MTVEAAIFDALRALVGDRVYPDVAPDNAARPYITYQQIGGQAINFVDGGAPSMRNSRFRINVWADRRADAAAINAQLEAALRAAPTLRTTVSSGPVSLADPDTRLRGASQDFSFWFA
jgi:hypothetical protein